MFSNLVKWATVVVTISACAAAMAAGDRHAGYYYPTPTSSETYTARAKTFDDSNRKRRIFFITELTNQMMENPYPPPFAIFPKGEHAEKLIITALYENSYNTLYRMRGLLAILTARARTTPIFQDFAVQDVYTFLDLLKLLGFTQLTVTDGDTFAHRIYVK
jgi:hypothetical protein